MPKGGSVFSGGYGRPPALNNQGTWWQKNRATNMMMGATVAGALSDYSGTMLRARERVTDAAWNKFDAERQAIQMRENAKKRMAQAGREAQDIQYQGRVMESDTIAGLAAQGGVTDPVLLAKIKQKIDYNALQAIFQGQRDASGMRMQALATEGAGRLNYQRAKAQKKVDRYAARSNLFSNIAFSAATGYGG